MNTAFRRKRNFILENHFTQMGQTVTSSDLYLFSNHTETCYKRIQNYSKNMQLLLHINIPSSSLDKIVLREIADLRLVFLTSHMDMPKTLVSLFYQTLHHLCGNIYKFNNVLLLVFCYFRVLIILLHMAERSLTLVLNLINHHFKKMHSLEER